MPCDLDDACRDLKPALSKNFPRRFAAPRGSKFFSGPVLRCAAPVPVPGDEICRENETILINQTQVAEVILHAPGGLSLPRWQGCHVLQDGEVFLLNEHPRSLDGRYFGIMQDSDLEGVATLLWKQR